MGVTVRQKEKGRGNPWWVFVAHNGKRKSVRVGDKAAAETVASKLREGLKSGDLQIAPQKKVPTFGEYAKKWLEGHGESNLKFSTYASYSGILENHLQLFDNRPIDQITRGEIKDLIYEKLKSGKKIRKKQVLLKDSKAGPESEEKAMAELIRSESGVKPVGLASNTVRNIKALISGVMTSALDDGLIQVNPVSRLGCLIKTKERKEDINPLTGDECKIFLEAVKQNSPRYYPFFLCALRTGMRLGELLALEWGNIDFNGGFLEIRRGFTKGRITTPKSGKSRRVDMSGQLSETLKALRVERMKETLAKGWGQVPDIVFVNEDGRRINAFNLRERVFFKSLAKANLRRIRMHDLRHTFASLLIQNNESLAYVKDQLGHHSIQITVDTYGHLVPGANRQAVDRLDDQALNVAQKGCI